MDYRAILQRSIDYIEDNLKTEITASELAQIAGFSLYHYYRLFQSATGMPVMQYILRRRLLNAICEIGAGRTRIDVALSYGFHTYPGFYKAFQREFGCTPSQYLSLRRVRRPCRLNLFEEEHMVITHKKAAALLKSWNLENAAISDVYYDNGSKSDSALYVGDDYVLKFTANPAKAKRHLELSQALESMGLASATPVLTTEGKAFFQEGELYFYLTRRLSGRQLSLDDLYEPSGEEKGRFIGTIIGQLHAALSKIEAVVNDADLLETVENWALPRAKEIFRNRDSFWNAFAITFRETYPMLPRQIIHRDPNPGNMILAQDKWGFIDFDLSERNARIFDPCYAATAILSESFAAGNTEKWLTLYKAILHGYDEVIHLTQQERKAVPYLILANQLVCVSWFAEQEKYAELLETNKQMTTWLIENFERLRIE